MGMNGVVPQGLPTFLLREKKAQMGGGGRSDGHLTAKQRRSAQVGGRGGGGC